jgi:hypothetical protein
MKTVLENSSANGTVVNPGKVEVDDETQKEIKNPTESKYKPYGREETPDVNDEMEENENERREKNERDPDRSFEDINNGLE